jgi:C_GCAxxG_C_C family probable redox protein
VIKTYAREAGLPENDSVKMVSTLGGGIGRSGQVCGAVSAAALIIGMKFGPEVNAGPASNEQAYLKVRELVDRFTKIHGSVQCREILGYDIGVHDDLMRAREAGVFTEKCPGFVASAAEILEEILSKE